MKIFPKALVIFGKRYYNSNCKIFTNLILGGIRVKDKITVLIADDNPDFTKTLCNYLEKENDLEVIGIAKDGNEAYEMIQGTHPDIALLDVIMPHLDGLGILEKLNESNMTKKPLCIMLSAVGTTAAAFNLIFPITNKLQYKNKIIVHIFLNNFFFSPFIF